MKLIVSILIAIFLFFSFTEQKDKTTDKMNLIFVYKANSDPISVSLDFIHKIASPQTYSCNLCKITYGNFAMKDKWRSYIDSIDFPVIFLYEDNINNEPEIIKDSPKPSAFIKRNGTVIEFLNKEDINACDNLDELIKLIEHKLQLYARTS